MARRMFIEQEIETARLRLAPLGVGDGSALSEMTDHPAILDAIPFLERPFTPAARGTVAHHHGQ